MNTETADYKPDLPAKNESRKEQPMSKHTPGPWYLDLHNNVMKGSGLVAFPGSVAGFNQKANGLLIAAAPELLEACKAALSDDQPYIEKCKAAIAKATTE